jgi:hypothetical protein
MQLYLPMEQRVAARPIRTHKTYMKDGRNARQTWYYAKMYDGSVLKGGSRAIHEGSHHQGLLLRNL